MPSTAPVVQSPHKFTCTGGWQRKGELNLQAARRAAAIFRTHCETVNSSVSYFQVWQNCLMMLTDDCTVLTVDVDDWLILTVDVDG